MKKFLIFTLLLVTLVSVGISATILPRTGLYLPGYRDQLWHNYLNPLIQQLDTYGGWLNRTGAWTATQSFIDIRLPQTSDPLYCDAMVGKVQVRETGDLEWCGPGNARLSVTGEATPLPQKCEVIEDLVAADDDYEFFIPNQTTTVRKVGCRCYGTCSTLAQFRLEDRTQGTMTGTPTCATSGDTAFTTITGNNVLASGEGLSFDVINTPTTGDRYSLCVEFEPFPASEPICRVIPDVVALDDDYEFWIPMNETTITSVGCRCRGTCTTMAEFRLEDRSQNVMTGTPTCATSGNTTFAAITAGGTLSSGEGLAFDVINTPTTGDVYTLCFTHS